MKRLLAILAFASVIGAAFCQTGQVVTSVQIEPFMTQNNLSYEDAAAALAIARMTGMTPEVVLSTRGAGVSTPYYELAPAYMISWQTGRPYSEIVGMYNGGQSWQQIARDLSVPVMFWNPNGVDTTSWTNSDFENAMWQSMLMSTYGLPATDVEYVTGLNIPPREALVAAVIASETHQPVRDIAASYSVNGSNWTVIHDRYLVVQQPVVAEQRFVETQTVTTTTTPTPVTPRYTPEVKRTYVPVVAARPMRIVHHTYHAPVRRHVVHRTIHHAMHRRTKHKKCCCCCK